MLAHMAARNAPPADLATKKPAPARRRVTATAPVVEPEIVEQSDPGPKPVTIPFCDRDMAVLRPDEGQLALLIDAQQWMARARAQMKRLGDLPPDAGDDHPLVKEAVESAERGLRHVGRLQRIVGSLFVDVDDWELICELLAERRLPWQEVAALPELIIRAHNEADRMMPDNRQARRQAGHRGKRV